MSGEVSSEVSSGVRVAVLFGRSGKAVRPMEHDDVPTEDEPSIEEKLEPARNGLDALVQAKANQKQQRKRFAKARIERLKQELESLRLGGGVNPKGAARRAVQIARELGSAGREFSRVTAEHKVVAGPRAEDDMADVAEALIRTADAFLQRGDGIGANSRFATKIRQLYARARNVVEDQRRRAADDGRDDREYVTLAERTRVLGIAIDNSVADSATVPPLDIKI